MAIDWSDPSQHPKFGRYANSGPAARVQNTKPAYANTSAGRAAAARADEMRPVQSRFDPTGQRTQYGTQSKPFGVDYQNTAGSTPFQDSVSGKWFFGPDGLNVSGNGSAGAGGGGGGRYGRGGGGGGGGGAKPINWGAMGQAMGYTPQPFEWQSYSPEQYEGTGFYDFNGGQYDRMRRGIQEGLAADLAAGNTAYGEARGELQRYQNPFAGRQYSQNPGMSQAMQRMMAANNVQADPTETARGAQADRAFGNVLALLAGNADQRQAGELRALGGDQRRFGESLNSEGRGMNLAVDMAMSRAREQYQKDKWLYGEQIAQQNWQANTQAAMYNNQGANTTGQANVQAKNDVTGGNMQMILDLIASGEVPPEMVTARAAGFPAGGEA